ncbi:MAG TPA: acyl-CoA dehydrogenase family protein, partial [bacterium]|nr:acyl-CoA dehydrogenase family protein [bacterium]
MAGKFKNVDYYDMDTLLSDEERMTRDTVRDFVDDKILPIIEEHNRNGTFPMNLVKEMADLGVFGANLPEKYGCAGM